MIKYKKYQNKNDKTTAYGKWYARAVHELMEFDEFIEHMANHHCVFSEGTIRGVLIEMEICLRELLLEGKAVRLDDLGIFAIGITTKGEDKAEDFTAQSIKGVGMNLYLGKRFRARQLFKDAKFKEADKYIGDGNYYEPEDDAEQAGTENQPSEPNNSGSQSQSVSAPTISGTTPFEESTEVSISAESGAEIRYTIDGSTPTAESTLYSESFTLTDSATIRAIAVKNGVSSSVATKTFTKSSGGYDGGDGGDGLDMGG